MTEWGSDLVTWTVFRRGASLMKEASLSVCFYSTAESSPSEGKQKLIQNSGALSVLTC